jgi:hypothetical protein
MNPPTIGHQVLINGVRAVAKRENADHVVILSHSMDKKRNPLPPQTKLELARIFFPSTNLVTSSPEIPSFLKYLGTVSDKYDRVVMVAGSDRVTGHRAVLNQYNGKEYDFTEIEVVSAGERDPDSEGAEGMSASQMRELAAQCNFADFKKGCPEPALALYMFAQVRFGMGLEDHTYGYPEFRAVTVPVPSVLHAQR